VLALKRTTTGLIASAVTASLLIAIAPASTSAAAARPQARPAAVAPAPALPAIPTVTASTEHSNISVPVVTDLAKGDWVTYGPVGGAPTKITLKMPGVSGVPLMGDWNGDGLMTPGYYANGAWFTTDVSVLTDHWTQKTTFGGAAGDVPVVGLIDKDPIADVGVFNNGIWKWQLSTGKPAPDDNFGQAGDIPVVGDWNGDGKSDLGVVRAGTWILRITGETKRPKWIAKAIDVQPAPEANAIVASFAFGDPTGLPVVGDWNADGKSEPGVVVGATWTVAMNGLDKIKKTSTANVPIVAGQTPLVGNRATAIGHCPTTTIGVEKSAKELAGAVKPPAKLRGNPSMPGGQQILATVQDGLRYAMVNDLTSRLKWRVSEPYYDIVNTGVNLESGIRRAANEAQAAAIMLTTSKWTTVNGITNAQLLDFAKWQLRSIACAHRAVSAGGWGNSWQSALWASTAGQAAWLLWPQLTVQERSYVAAMVAAEADYVAARGPRYFRDRNGKESTPGDSKADEVSWDSTAPALALAMMPNHPHHDAWLRSLVEDDIAAFARPSDLKNNQVINGVNISQALPGTNANEDGTITNHGIVNPDYTQNVLHLWWGASMLRQGNQPVPESAFLNADIIYRALAVLDFPSPPYAAPGGTSYKPGGQIYYPQKVGWGMRRPATFCGVDSFAAIYTPKDTNAKQFLFDHAADTHALQQRFTDGHIYLPGNAEEGYKYGKEEYALSQMALAWWAGAVPSGPKLRVITKAIPGINLNPR
jgi:hypothetical protein